MTYQSYSKGLQRIFTVFGLLFLLQQFGKDSLGHSSVPFILIITYFALAYSSYISLILQYICTAFKNKRSPQARVADNLYSRWCAFRIYVVWTSNRNVLYVSWYRRFCP